MSETQFNLSKVTMTMAIAFGVLFSINALCTCVMAAFMNTSWDEMTPFKHFIICVAILGNWTTLLMAYLSKTVARLESGKGLPTNGTDFFARSEDRQFQTQGLPLGQTQTETKVEVKTTETKSP